MYIAARVRLTGLFWPAWNRSWRHELSCGWARQVGRGQQTEPSGSVGLCGSLAVFMTCGAPPGTVIHVNRSAWTLEGAQGQSLPSLCTVSERALETWSQVWPPWLSPFRLSFWLSNGALLQAFRTTQNGWLSQWEYRGSHGLSYLTANDSHLPLLSMQVKARSQLWCTVAYFYMVGMHVWCYWSHLNIVECIQKFWIITQ